MPCSRRVRSSKGKLSKREYLKSKTVHNECHRREKGVEEGEGVSGDERRPGMGGNTPHI